MKRGARSGIGLVALLLYFGQAGLSAGLAGVWKATYTTRNGLTREATFELKVAGGELTGRVTSPRGSAAIAEGKVSGNDLSFTLIRHANYDEIPVRYQGTVNGDTLRLRMQYGHREPVEITATRAPAS